MPVLALDTSTGIAVALTTDGAAAQVLARRRVPDQRRHAELLAPMITEVLTEAGVDRRDLLRIVVGTGPAPFTGLRAGLVTARTLGFALGVPVHGVCSLDALAAQAFAVGLAPDGQVLVVTDARRHEVYAAWYRSSLGADVAVVAGPAVTSPAALAAEVAGAVVVGPGAALYPDHLSAHPGAPDAVDPAVLVTLARLRAERGEGTGTAPLYLRRPDVTPSATHKRATG